MYPYLRYFSEVAAARKAVPLDLEATHVSHHRIWPGDIDPWKELNNGRTLTLFDLGRLPLALRTGFIGVLKQKGWGLTVAGSVVRYRRRMTLFQRAEMRSRFLGADAKFIYVEQSLWTDTETCANHALIRMAVIGNRRLLPTEALRQALGRESLPVLPDWVSALFAADDARPWPPERV